MHLNCETGRSNPHSLIKWTVADETEKNSTSIVVAAPQSSWITKSNVSFVIPTGQHSVTATCQVINSNPFETIETTHKISILRKYTIILLLSKAYLLSSNILGEFRLDSILIKLKISWTMEKLTPSFTNL